MKQTSCRPELVALEDRLPPGSLGLLDWLASLAWGDPLDGLSLDSTLSVGASREMPARWKVIQPVAAGEAEASAGSWRHVPDPAKGRAGSQPLAMPVPTALVTPRTAATVLNVPEEVVAARALDLGPVPPPRLSQSPTRVPSATKPQTNATLLSRAVRATVTQGSLDVKPPEGIRITVQPCMGIADSRPEYSTFRGESELDEASAIAVDSMGRSFTAGTTMRTDGSGVLDAFVTMVSPAGACTTAVISSETEVNLAARGVVLREGPPIDTIYVDVELPVSKFAVLVICITYDDDGMRIGSVVGWFEPDKTPNDSGVAISTVTGDIYTVGTVTHANGTRDVLVLKFDPKLALAYVAFVHFTVDGVDVDTRGNAIAVDAEGNAYVGASAATKYGNENLTFRLSADGTQVEWAEILYPKPPTFTLEGGTFGIVVQGDTVTVAGVVTGQEAKRHDHLLARWQLDGTPLWSRAFALPGRDFAGRALGVDADGSLYTTGWIGQPGLDRDVHVTRFNPDGDVIEDQTRLGAPGTDEQGLGLAVEPGVSQPDVFLTGWTESLNFQPIVNACQPRYAGNRDAFIARLRQPLG